MKRTEVFEKLPQKVRIGLLELEHKYIWSCKYESDVQVARTLSDATMYLQCLRDCEVINIDESSTLFEMIINIGDKLRKERCEK